MSNATLGKFGYPATVIEDGPVWTVLLRPAQVTLGSLVLVCKEPVQAFSELSKEAFAGTVTWDAGWPGPPELGRNNNLDDTQMDALRRHLISLWG